MENTNIIYISDTKDVLVTKNFSATSYIATYNLCINKALHTVLSIDEQKCFVTMLARTQ